MSCNFMPCYLVRHFHVRNFQSTRSIQSHVYSLYHWVEVYTKDPAPPHQFGNMFAWMSPKIATTRCSVFRITCIKFNSKNRQNIYIYTRTGPSDNWSLGQVDPQTSEPSDNWNLGHMDPQKMDPRTTGTSDTWTLRQMDPRTTGQTP